MSISQNEFNYLLKLEKNFETSDSILLDTRWSRNILSLTTKDVFILDYYIGSIQINKFTYNKRFRKTIPMVRFDSAGRHTNPDGQFFDGPHIHVYKEGYDDKFAFPISIIGINVGSCDKTTVLNNFLKYCNINNCPPMQNILF
jgi:hypothetical protein